MFSTLGKNKHVCGVGMCQFGSGPVIWDVSEVLDGKEELWEVSK